MNEDVWRETREFLAAELQAGTFPGAGLVVSRKGKRVAEQYLGTHAALSRSDAPVTERTIHPAYSFSKLITATVLAIVQKDAGLDWSAPVSRYLPEFTGQGRERITLRHCLTHSAGIPNVEMNAVHTEPGWQTFLERLCTLTPVWEPGSKTEYHALTGHFLVAACARRQLQNQPWNTICQERLCRPLGLKSLTFGLPKDSDTVALTPQPAALPKSIEAFFPFAGHPAGGAWGTLRDFLAILELHNQEGVWKGKRLMPQETWTTLHTVQYPRNRYPNHDAWGLGFLLRGEGPATGSHAWFGFQNQNAPTVYGHAGIDTVIGVGDPITGNALVFITTNIPKPAEKTVPLRNGVTDRVFSALGK